MMPKINENQMVEEVMQKYGILSNGSPLSKIVYLRPKIGTGMVKDLTAVSQKSFPQLRKLKTQMN